MGIHNLTLLARTRSYTRTIQTCVLWRKLRSTQRCVADNTTQCFSTSDLEHTYMATWPAGDPGASPYGHLTTVI